VLDEVDEAGGLGDDGLAAQEAVGARAEGRRVLADLQHLEDRVAVDEGLVEVLVLGDAVGVDLQLDGLAGAVGLVVDELGLQARERHARADGGDQASAKLLQRVGLQEHLGGLDGALLEGVEQVLEHGGAVLAGDGLHQLAVALALASDLTEDLGGDEVVADREAQVVDRVADDEVLEGALVLEVRPRCGCRFDLVERRLGDVEVAALDDVGEVAVEERQQQRADVRAVDVGVRHDDDGVVAQLADVVVVRADAGAERGDQGDDLLAGQHLVDAGLLDVEDLAAQRQDRLGLAVAALLGGAAGRVTLDDEQLGVLGVALLAVGELAGQGEAVEDALAGDGLAGLAGGRTRARGEQGLLDDEAGRARVLLEVAAELLGDDGRDEAGDLARDQLVLDLRAELRVGVPDGDDADQALAHFLAGEGALVEGVLVALERAGLVGVAVDDLGQGAAKAGEVGAAVLVGDVVGEAEDRLLVDVGPLQGDLHAEGDGRPSSSKSMSLLNWTRSPIGSLFCASSWTKLGTPPSPSKFARGRPEVAQDQLDAGVEVAELAEAVGEDLEVDLRRREDQRVRVEVDAGAAALARAEDLDGGDRVAALEAGRVGLALAPDLELEPVAERVDDRHADAVEAAGDLVGLVVELAAGVQHREDDDRGVDDLAADLHRAGRDAAAVVLDRDRVVGVDDDLDRVAMAGEGLVDRVVDDLEDHLVEARAVAGVADVHARPLAHGFEALEHRDGVGVVLV
jgi:hypothetical protein